MSARPTVTTLTPKQQKFLNSYLTCWNATEAAREAKYKHPNQQGPDLLKNEQIAAAIAERLDEAVMSAGEVLARLAEHARSDIGEFLDADGNLDLGLMKTSGMTRLIKRLNTSKATGTSPKGGDWERQTLTLELHDAQAALSLLARHHKLLTDNVDHTTGGEKLPPVQIYIPQNGRD